MPNEKTTILYHSRSGLSALVKGLKLAHGSPETLLSELLRLWPQMRKPGQFVSFALNDQTVVCFNSGAAPKIVQTVFSTGSNVWGVKHLKATEIGEGPLSALRAGLFARLPSQRWLIHYELVSGGVEKV